MSDPTRRVNTLTRGALVISLGLSVLACDAAGSTAPSASATSPSSVGVGPDATPSGPPAKTARQYALALVAAFESDPLVTHVVQTGTMPAANAKKTYKVTVTMSLDISRRNMSRHLVIKTAGKTTKQDLVVLGKSGYARAGSDAWNKVSRKRYEDAVTATILRLRMVRDPANLEDMGAETIAGRDLRHLASIRAIPYATGIPGTTGLYDKVDIWMEEDGTPVLVKIAYSVKDHRGTEIDGTTEFRFTQFGGPIKIVAPTVAG